MIGTIAGLSGFTRTAIRLVCGKSSLKISSRFAFSSGTKKVEPVMLPPGRARLSTRPKLPNSRVPSLHGHCPASSLLRTRPPPSRRRTISRDLRLYARPASADFAAGRGGLLQLLDAAASPCCRSKPRRSAPPRQPDCDGPCCLRGVIDRSASGVWIFRGQLTFTCVTAR